MQPSHSNSWWPYRTSRPFDKISRFAAQEERRNPVQAFFQHVASKSGCLEAFDFGAAPVPAKFEARMLFSMHDHA